MLKSRHFSRKMQEFFKKVLDIFTKDEEKSKSAPSIKEPAKFTNTDLHINRAFHIFV